MLTLWLDHILYARVVAHSSYNDHIVKEEAPWGEAEAWYLRGFAGRFTGELRLSTRSIFDREQIHFLTPGWDEGHVTWYRSQSLDVEQDDEGNPHVAHPHRDIYEQGDPEYYTQHRTSLEIPLATFKTEVVAQQQARIQEYGGLSFSSNDSALLEGASPPTLINNAHDVNDYYVEVGAYDHADGPPKLPPADCHGTAVPEGRDNIWLVNACIKLLEGRDTLRGTAALNWATNLAITAWGGITISEGDADDILGDYITQLDLSDEDLDGSIPAELGNLHTLTALKLNDNDLTGHIPAELAELTELTELKLSGNDFIGCIPEGLRSIADHDLDDLGLADCMPVPESTTIGSDEVRFTSSMYTFSVPEDAETGAAVGSVLADPGRRGVTYSITAGNDSSVFAIGSETGAITVAAALDYENRDHLYVDGPSCRRRRNQYHNGHSQRDRRSGRPAAGPLGAHGDPGRRDVHHFLDCTGRGGQVRGPIHHGCGGRCYGDLDGPAGDYRLECYLRSGRRPGLQYRVPVPGEGLWGRRSLHRDVGSRVGCGVGGDRRVRAEI